MFRQFIATIYILDETWESFWLYRIMCSLIKMEILLLIYVLEYKVCVIYVKDKDPKYFNQCWRTCIQNNIFWTHLLIIPYCEDGISN